MGTSTQADLVIRNGSVVDGTGAPARQADVAIEGDRVVAVEAGAATVRRTREIDATGPRGHPRLRRRAHPPRRPAGVGPAAHLVVLARRHLAVLGNCGVTFAPVRPRPTRVPRRDHGVASRTSPAPPSSKACRGTGPPTATTSSWLDRIPKGINVGGMVGHVALRVAAMDERAFAGDDVGRRRPRHDVRHARRGDGRRRPRRVDQPHLHAHRARRPPVPGTFAGRDELLAFADVLGRTARACSRAPCASASATTPRSTNTRAEVALIGEFSRRSGRPVSFGLTQ